MAGTLEKQTSILDKTPKITESPEQIQEKFNKIKKEKAGEIQELHLETMSNEKFLEMDRKTRLESITYEAIDIDSIQNSSSMTFRFDFGQGVDQTNLYKMTTAGQVLPPTVREVQVGGVQWTRNGLYGEFFNIQGQRLLIHEKTELVCSNVISKEDIKKMEDAIIADNDKYKDDLNYTVILECAKRNIPYEIAMNIFVKELTRDGKTSTPINIELLITKFERAKDSFNGDFPNIAIQNGNSIGPEFLSFFLAYTHVKLDDTLRYKFGITPEIQKTYNIVGSMRVSGSYGTDAAVSETVKIMADLNPEESIALAKKIFHEGPATNLLIAIDGGTGTMIKRMIALGYHEGGLKFGRQNPDPASGYNYGTFQIGGSNSTPESSQLKYNQCLQAGVNLAQGYNISTSTESITDLAQKDLMTHLGYIDSQRGGNATFAKLRDGSLSDGEVVDLMSNKIQGGINDIGKSVVSQINNTKIDLTTLV